jgi:S1-C subfamily serine protease
VKKPSVASVGFALVGAALAAVGLAAGAGAGTARGGRRHTFVVDAVGKAGPAVVNITTDLPGSGNGMSAKGSGSGVIVHPGGWVVTNSHIVRGALRVTAELARCTNCENRLFDARVVEDDPAHDLALLRIGGRATFPYIGLCEAQDVMVGETAIAIGNPYGLGDTVTVGIISATGRTASLSSGTTIRGLLQTDASINLGNSGGALINLDGDLIGINSSKHPSAQGIAFTVPSDAVQRLLDRNLGSASHPASPRSRDDDEPTTLASAAPPAPVAASAGKSLPPVLPGPAKASRPVVGLTVRTGPTGLVVLAIAPDSTAELAGLHTGDVIVDVDGHGVPTAPEFTHDVTASAPGTSYALTVQRDAKRLPIALLAP